MDAPPQADPRRATLRSAWAVLLITLTLGLFADLATKWAAFEWIAGKPVWVDRAAVLASDRLGELIPPHPPVRVVPGVLHLTLVLNPGAVFGIGAGQRWLFIAFTAVAVVFSLYVFLKWTTPRDRAAHVALGLLLAGGLGNLYDRLRFACVRDFLHPLPGLRLPWGIRWPNGSDEVWPYVSNIADLWLIIGIAVLLVFSWKHPADPASDAPTPAAGTPPRG